MTVATADGTAVDAAPPAAGCNETSTLAGGMVPVGKPEPVRLMLWMPGCPALGDVVVASVTLVCAIDRVPAIASTASNANQKARLEYGNKKAPPPATKGAYSRRRANSQRR